MSASKAWRLIGGESATATGASASIATAATNRKRAALPRFMALLLVAPPGTIRRGELVSCAAAAGALSSGRQLRHFLLDALLDHPPGMRVALEHRLREVLRLFQRHVRR